MKLALVAATLAWTGAHASEPAPAATVGPAAAALIAALGQEPPARTAFAEARFMRILDRPLVVSGQLAWLGGDRLERRVEHPHAEVSTIAGGEVTQQRGDRPPRRFSLARAPQLRALLDSFVALLGGDAGRLGAAFEVRVEGDAAGPWALVLTPRDARVARSVADITVTGEARTSRCIEIRDADGDRTFDLLGALASRMPEHPAADALAALCRGAR